MSAPAVRLRPATAADAATILGLVRELAEYEREPAAVVASCELLAAQLAAERPPFECLLAEAAGSGEVLGFALYFHNYSTWRGRPGLYLEDLFVRPAARGRGVGRLLLARLAAVAVARGCPRMEWAVLAWNRSAIDFYRRLGAEELSEWRTYRLQGEALDRLAAAGGGGERG